MGFFSFLFGGKYPSTKKYEAQLDQNVADFERFKQIAKSAEYARYIELNNLTNSIDFKNKVNKLKTEKFSDTEPYKKEQEYKKLKDSDDIKKYCKFKDKQLDQRLALAKQSSDYNRFVELSQVVSTSEFKALTAQRDFKKTPEYQTLNEYKKLAKSSAVKFINKTEASDAYKNFVRTEGSDKLKKFKELEEYVNSQEFKSFKAEIEDSKRFKKSEESKILNEYEALAKSKDITWFIKNEKSNAFASIAKRKLIFEDNFVSFDKAKWEIGSYAGNAFAAGTIYSQMNERQITNSKNIEVSASELSIITRKETATGKRWNPALGFVNSEFEFTSSLINTGNSFRQLYGQFDFKVKMSKSSPVVHTIWMQSEKNTPIINVASLGSDKKKIIVGSANGDKVKKVSVDGADFSEYQIITLLWTPEKLSWSINGVEVFSQKDNVPQTPMYINIGSSITNDGDVNGAIMTLDWIRVYEINK
ncbi:MAG: glycoside hydrolase family 16 protein [Bacteroidales bacterium]|nr:glycoside hydrolase family 16 protein [Bacteroidales bacterium]